MSDRPRVGLVSVGVPWFDTAAAIRNLGATRRVLGASYEVKGPNDLVTDEDALHQALPELRRCDAVVLQIGTFPDGNLPARLAELVDAPIVVHSLPEPGLDSAVALNSLCGAHMTTYTLSALEREHSVVHAGVSDDAAARALLDHSSAAVAVAKLRGQRLTLLGFRAPGFYPCSFDEILLRRQLGIRIEYADLHEIFQRLDGAARKKAPQREFPTIEGGSLDPEAVAWMERYYAALSGFCSDGGHDLVAVRDWPELEHFDPDTPGGAWPAVGWLQDEGVDLAPEGDVNGAITMRIAHALSGEPPFFADISAWDDAASTLTLWHYGGPTALAREQAEIRFGAEGREVEFTLRPGRGHLLRLGLKDGKLRMLSVAVEVLDERVTLRRAAARARTTRPAGEVVRALLDGAWEHHVTLAYGDLEQSVRAFARQSGIELTEL